MQLIEYNSVLKWTLLFLCFAAQSCDSKPLDFTDANGKQAFPDALLRDSPLIVVARIENRIQSKKLGLMKMFPIGNQVPATRIEIQMSVLRSLKGGLIAGDRLNVIAYEGTLGVSGAPQGVSGNIGSIGIYFLYKADKNYRPMVDQFRIWIPLHPKVKLQDAIGNLQECIWRLQAGPYLRGDQDITFLHWGDLNDSVGWTLGKVKTVNLFKEILSTTKNQAVFKSVCLHVNSMYSGFGAEECLVRLRNEDMSDLKPKDKALAQSAWARIGPKNQEVLDIVKSRSIGQLEEWAGFQGPDNPEVMLQLLSSHFDPEIAKLSKQWLNQDWGKHKF